MLVTIEVGNLTVKFQQLSVTPFITNCKQNDSSISFELRTKSAEGNVIVSLLPGITASRSFFAYKELTSFSFPLTDDVHGNYTLIAMADLGQSSCWLVLNKTYLIGNYTPTWTNITGLPYNFAALLTGRNLPGFEELSPILFAAAVVIGIIILVIIGIVVVVIIASIWPYIYPFVIAILGPLSSLMSNRLKPQSSTNIIVQPSQPTAPTQPTMQSQTNKVSESLDNSIRNVIDTKVRMGIIKPEDAEAEYTRQLSIATSKRY